MFTSKEIKNVQKIIKIYKRSNKIKIHSDSIKINIGTYWDTDILQAFV